MHPLDPGDPVALVHPVVLLVLLDLVHLVALASLPLDLFYLLFLWDPVQEVLSDLVALGLE